VRLGRRGTATSHDQYLRIGARPPDRRSPESPLEPPNPEQGRTGTEAKNYKGTNARMPTQHANPPDFCAPRPAEREAVWEVTGGRGSPPGSAPAGVVGWAAVVACDGLPVRALEGSHAVGAVLPVCVALFVG
jgi:hypothetical protein